MADASSIRLQSSLATMTKARKGAIRFSGEDGIAFVNDGYAWNATNVIPVSYSVATPTDPAYIFMAPRPCRVLRAMATYATAAGATCLIDILKVPNNTALASGTKILLQPINGNGTANIPQYGVPQLTPVITAADGSGAVIQPIIDGGRLMGAYVAAGGSGYTNGTGTATITQPSNGTIVGVEVDDAGAGYASTPTVVFTGGGGTGAAATAVMSGGRVVDIYMTNVGSGYTSAPVVSFTGGTPVVAAKATASLVKVTTAATATVTVASNAITAVTVTNPGKDYDPFVHATLGTGDRLAVDYSAVGSLAGLTVTVLVKML